MQHVYMLRERESIRLNENIYKIGKTTQIPKKRFNSYPKNSELILCLQVNNCHNIENEIKKIFTRKFNKRHDHGSEYFEGDINAMRQEFQNIVNKEENKNDKQAKDQNIGNYLPNISRLNTNVNRVVVARKSSDQKSNPTFRSAVIANINEFCSKNKTEVFARGNIDDKYIAKLVGSQGLTPSQTINKTLQELRDSGFIKFVDNKGKYERNAINYV